MKKFLFTILACSLFLNTASAQTDAINIGTAAIVNAPNVRSWPITTAITQVSFDGSVTRINFTKKDGPGRWPDVTPAGWEGPLEFTLWLFVKDNGNWTGSAFIQFWNGRDGSGKPGDPDVPSLYSKNWYYAARWAPIFGHGPIASGESIGFMVTSGNQRDSVGPNSVQERSNIVVLPATDNGVFNFGAAQSAETILETLNRLRASYPAGDANAAIYLNAVAWAHRNEGIVLLGKKDGHNCPTPAGVLVSCDYLVDSNTKRGWDVIKGDDAGTPQFGGDGEDLTTALADGSRTLVAPVDPSGITPPPPPPPAGDLAERVKAIDEALGKAIDMINLIVTHVQALEAAHEEDDAAVSALSQRVSEAQADIHALKARPTVTSCTAAANLGAFRIPISCKVQ